MNPVKILVVDDSQMMHRSYELMLRQYRLVYARDGREALDRLNAHPDVDLVLITISPMTNGVELVAELLGRGSEAPTVVVVVHDGQEAELMKAMESGAAAYIKKPFAAEELNEVITRLPPR